MEDRSVVKMIFIGNPAGKRRDGRHRVRRHDNVQGDLTYAGDQKCRPRASEREKKAEEGDKVQYRPRSHRRVTSVFKKHCLRRTAPNAQNKLSNTPDKTTVWSAISWKGTFPLHVVNETMQQCPTNAGTFT
jgi:hypothetical protein